MVDSDILIWHFRGLPEISAEVKKLIDKGILYTSPVAVAEIFAGARKNEEAIINNLLSSIKIIEIGKEIGKATGQYLNKY